MVLQSNLFTSFMVFFLAVLTQNSKPVMWLDFEGKCCLDLLLTEHDPWVATVAWAQKRHTKFLNPL